MSLIEEALRRAKEPLIQQPQDQVAPPAPAARQDPQPPAPVKGSVRPAPKVRPARPVQTAPPAHSWSEPSPAAAAGTSAAHPAWWGSLPLAAIAAAVLGLSLALLIGGLRWMQQQRPASAPAAPAQEPADSASSPEAQPPSPQTPAVHRHAPVLTGIVGGQGQSYAVIDGAIVSAGERIGTLVLVEITPGGVRLRRDDGTYVVLKVPR